jgi:hypothetical protein
MSINDDDLATWAALQPPKAKGKPTPAQIEERKVLKGRELEFLKELCARAGQPEDAIKKQLKQMTKTAELAQKKALKAGSKKPPSWTQPGSRPCHTSSQRAWAHRGCLFVSSAESTTTQQSQWRASG